MSYWKIGFHTGPGGNRTGIGMNWATLTEFEVPAPLISVDDYGPCFELERYARESGVDHPILFRFNDKIPGFNPDVPDYDKDPYLAAMDWWAVVHKNLPPEFVNGLARDRVWIVAGNEVDKNRADWLGWWARYVAEIANLDGFKIAAFGWAAGEPEYDDWEEEGMAAYLRYCHAHPDMAAIVLHEYSYSLDLNDGLGYLIGRYKFLEDACYNLGISTPNIFIGEFGWTYNQIPNPTEAIRQLMPIADIYAESDAVKGAMLWYLGPGFGTIADQTQSLISPLTDVAIEYSPSPPPVEPPPPPPPSDGTMDLAQFFMPPGDDEHGPIYMVTNNWSGGEERVHLARSPRGSKNHFYVSKNSQWERRFINDNWIWLQADTSPDDKRFYVLDGDPWLPRYMKPGDTYRRVEHVQFYAKSDCRALESTVNDSYILFKGIDYELSNELGLPVIQLSWIKDDVVEEDYWYGNNIGLVKWRNRWGKQSKFSHFVPLHEGPNPPIAWTCGELSERNPSTFPPPPEPPKPPEESLFDRAWDKSVEMQVTRQGAIQLNKDAAIQRQITFDNAIGLNLQKVTNEFVIDGVTFMAAESLTGECPRRVYFWEPGKPIGFFSSPKTEESIETREEYLQWPVDNPIRSINSDLDDDRSYGPHEGVDIFGNLGDAVLACMEGRVVWASDLKRSGGPSAYGNHVILVHPNGWITWYCHLNEIWVAVDDYVSRGEPLGSLGSTGNSTGPHLHLTLQIPGDGRAGYIVPDVVDPELYLR